jgi:hypothetical protein
MRSTFAVAASGVEIVGAHGGFCPGRGKIRTTNRRVEEELLLCRPEELDRTLPVLALDGDHGAPEGGGWIAPQHTAREIVLGVLEAASHVAGGAAHAEEDGILFKLGPFGHRDAENAERLMRLAVTDVEAREVERGLAARGRGRIRLGRG